MFAAVGAEDVILNLAALIPTEVDIEIGRRGPVFVDKALEVEVKLDRIDIGDTQTIRHDGVGPRAAPT